MFKIILKKIFLIFFVLMIFNSCASTNNSAKIPDWVYDTDDNNSEDYLKAVGSGITLEEAEANAVGNIAKIIRQNIMSEGIYESSKKTSENADGVESTNSIHQIVRTYTYVKDIVGVEITKKWGSGNTDYYAMAVLDKAKANLYYSDKIKSNDVSIKECLALADSGKDLFYVYKKLSDALLLTEKNEYYMDIVFTVNKNSYKDLSNSISTYNDVQKIMDIVCKNIKIKIAGLEDESKIGNYFYDYFTSKGFIVNSSDYNYLFNCNLEFENTSSPDSKLHYSRYIFSGSLKDIANDSVLYSYSASERIAHQREEDAQRKSVVELEKKLKKEFNKDFIDYIYKSQQN